MKTILAVILSIFLLGCASTKKVDTPVIPPAAVINIDSAAFLQCAMLKEDIVIATFEDAILAYGDLSTAYGVCAKQQSVSIKLIKQLGNIK